MDLIQAYEEYKMLNDNYVQFISLLVSDDINEYNEATFAILMDYRNKYEQLRDSVEELKAEVNEEDNLRDLKYLVVDGLFASMDISNFYKHEAFGRVKMRAINYESKKKRAESGLFN